VRGQRGNGNSIANRLGTIDPPVVHPDAAETIRIWHQTRQRRFDGPIFNCRS